MTSLNMPWPVMQVCLAKKKRENRFIYVHVEPGFGQLLFCSTAAGILGGAFGNPSDVVNVRMQNDGQLPPEQRRNYRNVIHGMLRICREEGPHVLLRGLGSSTHRAVLMTVSQMTSYDVFKDKMFVGYFQYHDSLGTHFGSSVLAVSSLTSAHIIYKLNFGSL